MVQRPVRRIALYAGGGLGGLLVTGIVGLAGVMRAEVKLAERRIPIAKDDPPPSNDTVWAAAGVSRTRPPIRIAMLGDSTAAGYGVSRDRDTPGVRLAIGISEVARRPSTSRTSRWSAPRRPISGSRSTRCCAADPELVVIMVGANDVTEGTKPSVAVPFLEEAVVRLSEAGIEVVVGTCPDLGTIRPLPQPLRAYARRLSRAMAREQTVAVVRAGGRTVSLGDLLGPLFMARLDFFSEDRFHPSASGYEAAADAVLPSCLDALGIRTRTRSASPFTTRRVKTAKKAAAQAVAHPGAEVAAAERFGRSEGRGGPFAQLRRRRPRRSPVTSHEAAIPVSAGPTA